MKVIEKHAVLGALASVITDVNLASRFVYFYIRCKTAVKVVYLTFGFIFKYKVRFSH